MKNDGGFAFPSVGGSPDAGVAWRYHGMTLRDWFAGQALAGLLANSGHFPGNPAEAAYRYADAMLAARGA